jgi:diguanylate cyclase (GGDEF) domain
MQAKKPKHYIEPFARLSLERFLGSDFDNCCWYGYKNSNWVDDNGLIIKKNPLRSQLDICRKNGRLWNKVEKTLFVKVDDLDIIVQVVLTRVVNKPTQEKIVTALTDARRSARDNFSATHDGLTGLLNRESFEDDLIKLMTAKALVTEAASGSAFKPEVTYLLSLDIDHFKLINDLHGHSYGDVALAAFAWRIEDVVDNFVKQIGGEIKARTYRVGGEEFHVLVSGGVSIDDIGELSNKLNASVSTEVLPSDDEWQSLSKMTAFEGIKLPHAGDRKATVSIGVAWATPSVEKNGSEAAVKIKRHADIALYSAKLGGRDRFRLFPQILAKYGRILEVHAGTNIVAIDIGEDVGVQLGQEFFVIHPDFSGEVNFFAGEGRSRRRLGTYPRIRVGRIRVVDVQREVAFCKIIAVNSGISSLVEGSTLEEIPLGSVSHLLSSQDDVVSRSFTGIEGVKNILTDPSTAKSWVAVDFEITNFNQVYKNQGSAAANLLLARTIDLISEKFGSKSRIGYVEGGEIVAAVHITPNTEFLNQLSELISGIDEVSGGLLGFRIGYIIADEHPDIAALDQAGAERGNIMLELARAAQLSIDPSQGVIANFSSTAVASLIWGSRRDLRHERGIADFERFNGLGIISGAIYNQVGLCFAEMLKPNLISAERYLRRSTELDPETTMYWANLGLVQFISGKPSDAASSFNDCLKITNHIPSGYEAATLLSYLNGRGDLALLDVVTAHPFLLDRLKASQNSQHHVSATAIESLIPYIENKIIRT